MVDIRQPAYQGRPEPTKIAKRLMLILILLLILGFFRAGIENGWFSSFIAFVKS